MFVIFTLINFFSLPFTTCIRPATLYSIYEYKFYVSPLTTRHFFFFFFFILNFGYFIKKIKQIHGKLWLVKQKVKHQKCYKEFVFVNLPTTLHWYRIQIKGARSPITALDNKLVESLVFDQYILIYNYKSYIISILTNIINLFSD